MRSLRTSVGPFIVRGMQSSRDIQELIIVEPFKVVGVESSGEACEPLRSLASFCRLNL